jgi:hypothetical protein
MASTSNVVKRFGIVDLTEAVEDAIDYQHFSLPWFCRNKDH